MVVYSIHCYSEALGLFFYLLRSVYDTNTSNAVYYIFLINSNWTRQYFQNKRQIKHQFTAHFENILRKCPLCTLTLLTLTTYTCNHTEITI